MQSRERLGQTHRGPDMNQLHARAHIVPPHLQAGADGTPMQSATACEPQKVEPVDAPDRGRAVRGQCLCGRVMFHAAIRAVGRNADSCPTRPRRRRSDVRNGLVFDATELTWINGKTLVGWFEFAPGIHRAFCSDCGTRLFNRYDFAFLPMEGHDAEASTGTNPASVAAIEVTVPNRRPWFEIEDDVILM